MKQDSISYIVNSVTEAEDSADSLYADGFGISSIIHGKTDSISEFQTTFPYTTKFDSDRHGGATLPFNLEQADGIFGLLLLCFLFFSHIYNGGLTFLKENIAILFSSNRNKRLTSEITGKENFFTAFLVFQSLILISICLYCLFVERKLSTTNTLSPFVSIICIAAIMGIFWFVKIWIYKFVGYILDIKHETSGWVKINILNTQILGILYFIPTLVLVYSNIWHIQLAIIMFTLFLVTQLVLFYRITSFFIQEKFNFLFLITYLCSVEIIPYIFLSAGLFLFYQNDVINMLL